MQAPIRGDGAHFDPSAEYRMYHGDRIPGFPRHPHRGFETVTATIDGVIDHSDSCGNAGRYGQGDLQWMTAGRGVVHGEMFPLINDKSPNFTKFFQIWLNLPRNSKMVNPDFVMHWSEDIPHYTSPDNSARVTVWAGEFMGLSALSPPVNSYASESSANVGIWYITLQPGGSCITLPPIADSGNNPVNRCAYFVEGSEVTIGGTSIKPMHRAVLNASESVLLVNTHSTAVAEVLVLQGRPIGEPVVQHGPFVMNTRQEIQQAFSDYQATQFGGWSWHEEAVVFPASKGRFALLNGKETYPPS